MVLHLEENPADEAQQDTLHEMLDTMLRSLKRRYPDYVSGVMVFYTSNYAPSAAVGRHATLVRMIAPAADMRAAWCQSVLDSVNITTLVVLKT